MGNDTKKTSFESIKNFVKNNTGNIYINVESVFSEIMDGLEYRNEGFTKAETSRGDTDNTLGIKGAWFLGTSQDHLETYEDKKYKGFEVSNANRTFIIAIKK